MIHSIDYDTGEFFGYATHPNGDKVKITDCGIRESDTNAFVSSPGYPQFEWDESGEELSWDILNERHPDGKSYLHEWTGS